MRKALLIVSITLLVALGFGFKVSALTLSPPTIEVSAKPGETVQMVSKLFNDTGAAMVLRPTAMTFAAKNETGQPDFVDDKSGIGLQSWIEIPETVTLAPQERRSVVVTIKIPKTADPGGHYAAIFWGTNPPKVQSGAGIEGVIAMLVLVNIEGDVKEEAKIIEFKTEKTFLTHLPVNFIARIQNSGTVHVHPAGSVMIRNMFGRQSAVLPFNIQPATGNVLPKSIRRFDFDWAKRSMDSAASEWSKEWNNFAFGRYTVELHTTYGPSNKLISATTSFWVFPWMISLVTIIILVVVFFALRAGLEAYNRSIILKYTQGKGRKK